MSDAIITLVGQGPSDYLDRAVSFAEWLQPGDSLATTVVTAQAGLVVGDSPAPTIVNNAVVFWLSGGVAGGLYLVWVEITTTEGRIFTQTCQIAIGTPSADSFNRPTLDGYMQWMRGQGFAAQYVPADSIFWSLTYDIAVQTVNLALANIPQIYTLAVYNLGADMMVNWAPDQPGETFLQDLRDKFGIYNFAPGVVSASSDNGTSSSLLNPDFMKGLTLANLQNLKTPYGRQYLAWAQSFGPIWGLT